MANTSSLILILSFGHLKKVVEISDTLVWLLQNEIKYTYASIINVLIFIYNKNLISLYINLDDKINIGRNIIDN